MIVPPTPPEPGADLHLEIDHSQQANRSQQLEIDERASPVAETERTAMVDAYPLAATDDDNSCYLADDDATVDLGQPTADVAGATEHREVAQLKAQAAATTKRRSSWRHLLSPSYKSRSDEFHKFFASDIPKSERLIADYSCALSREMLIQGRLYVSVNYLAFYSNLFGWITKLVVRLRDIRDIHKANTARFIPNAIQILTQSDEKHVFASFIARDKSFLLIWRIWRNNNQLKERLSDQEIRKLVHLSYGKDLGLNDLEESEISAQPLPRTPANFIDELRAADGQQVVVLDRNNNNNNNNNGKSVAPGKQRAAAKRSRFKSRSQNQKDLMVLMSSGATTGADGAPLKQRGHARYSSVDCGRLQPAASQVDVMLSELSGKLAELSSTAAAGNEMSYEVAATCSPASSAVVVDTPASLKGRRSRESHESPSDDRAAVAAAAAAHIELGGEQIFASGAPNTEDAQQQVGSFESAVTMIDLAKTCDQPQQSIGTDEQQQQQQQVASQEQVAIPVENSPSSTAQRVGQIERNQQQQQDALMGPPLNTSCECDTHDGELIADEQLDINVDILFSLIFTNSKFMRTHMMQRGQEDLVVGKWRRPAGQGDRSNSSTLSSRGGGGGESGTGEFQGHRVRRGSTTSSIGNNHQPQARKNVKTKQVRQLNYLMNVNHVLAKQVQVEEKQNICQVRPGVYVLESQTVNSGFPCSESFTIDLKYCLTRTSHLNKSRLRVYGQINFLKEKQSWRLAMVKPIIEKQSMQGIHECITDLIASIRKHIELKRQQGDPTVYLGGAGGPDATAISPMLQQPPPPLAQQQRQQQQQQVGGTAKHHHQHHQHSRSSLARAKSKLKERKLRNMYKYYIKSRSHNRADDDDEGAPRSPGGATSSLVSSASSASSSMSSLCSNGGGCLDDDESMIMMLASNGGGARSKTRRDHLTTTNRNHHRRHQNHPYDDDATDDDDDQTGDEYDDARATNHLLVGRRSFSDLEDGPTQFDGNLSDQDGGEWPRRRRHLESDTSNATLNNEQPPAARAAPIKSRLLGAGWMGNDGSRHRRSSAQSTAGHHNNHPAAHNHEQVRRTRSGDRARSSVAVASQPRVAVDARDKQQQQSALASRRWLTTQNLVLLLLACLVLLVFFMSMSHIVILRRLGHVEQLLVANCNSSRQGSHQPAPFIH